MTTLQDLENLRDKPNWCPGCGDFGIQVAVKQAIVNAGLEKWNVFISSGIGCGSKLNQWVDTYGHQGLHGRSLPVAMGAALANPELTVMAVGGDGDGYGIGMAHFINTMRRNLDITYLVQDNQNYGLTLGQVSPTSEKGMKSVSSPYGVIETPVNPIRLALSSDCTFVARGFAGDVPHLAGLIEAAIKHKGFALIDVLQPCVTFNKINTYEFFRKRVYKLEETDGYDVSNLEGAFARAGEWGDKIPIGLFYKVDKPTYADEDPGLKSGVPVKADISPQGGVDIGEMMESFM